VPRAAVATRLTTSIPQARGRAGSRMATWGLWAWMACQAASPSATWARELDLGLSAEEGGKHLATQAVAVGQHDPQGSGAGCCV
jgi:hypothetical protein